MIELQNTSTALFAVCYNLIPDIEMYMEMFEKLPVIECEGLPTADEKRGLLVVVKKLIDMLRSESVRRSKNGIKMQISE